MKKKLTLIAKKLRREQTPWEAKLWYLFRRKNFEGLKFRRQYPIGKYIIDFCCPEKRLVIELDGGGHSQDIQIKADERKDKFLKSSGYKILRIWNNGIDNNLEGVFEKIIELIS